MILRTIQFRTNYTDRQRMKVLIKTIQDIFPDAELTKLEEELIGIEVIEQ